MSPAPDVGRLKAVLDTNVYIAVFQFSKGRTAALWTAVRDQRYRLLVSPDIIREMARVLRDDFGWQDEQPQKVVRRVAEVAGAGVITPHTKINAVSDDPDDNRILECAVDGKADLVVSNDRHLLDLETYAGIPISTGLDFRRVLGFK
jgi:uncharacterized protein